MAITAKGYLVFPNLFHSPLSVPLPLCQQKHLFAAAWTYASSKGLWTYLKSSCLCSKGVNSYWNCAAWSQRQEKKNVYFVKTPIAKLQSSVHLLWKICLGFFSWIFWYLVFFGIGYLTTAQLSEDIFIAWGVI